MVTYYCDKMRIVARSGNAPTKVSRSSATSWVPPSGKGLVRLRSTADIQNNELQDSLKLLFVKSGSPVHDWPGHPENAERVPSIMKALQKHGLSSHPGVAELTHFQAASVEDLVNVHDPRYLRGLEQKCISLTDVSGLEVDSSPTYITRSTFIEGLQAAGAVKSLVDAIMDSGQCSTDGSSTTGFALCRPPGHHAVKNGPMGFCILNNAAVASMYARERYGLKKIAIVDFDVHHGNGTQDAFYSDPNVLFISTHQRGSFPNTGKMDEVGSGDGEGMTINCPLPGDSGHRAAMASMEEIVAPALKNFQPDMIIVSAGYDAHFRDPLASLNYRSSTYHELSKKLVDLAAEICKGRCLFILEGGYDLDALGESVANSFAAILGQGPIDSVDPSLFRDEPLDKVKDVLNQVKSIHCL
eukprot:jgi/Picsp_1/1486/NSC_04964-R1_histone deacetylase